MTLRLVCMLAVCGFTFAIAGCGGGADVATPEEKAELDAQMQQDMQNMQEMMGNNPSATGGGTTRP